MTKYQLAILIKTIVISIFITSCNNGNVVDYTKNLTEIKGEYIPINELIGVPHEIIIKENLLIYVDPYEDFLLSVYDITRDSFSGRYLSRGNGPGEAIPPLRLFPSDQKNHFYVYQPNKQTLSSVSLPDFRLTDLVKFTLRPETVKKTKDFFVGAGIFEQGMFWFYDQNFNPVFEGGKYPFDGENRNQMEASYVYQGSLCTNPTHNKFAFGCLYSDYLAFYEIKNNEIVVKKEYFSKDADVEFGSSTLENGATMFRLFQKDNTVRNYNSSFGSGTYCYMLFNGKTNEENEKCRTCGNYIIVFDWDGNYIRTFQSDYEIFDFYVEEENNLIYAIVLGDDGEKNVAKFKL